VNGAARPALRKVREWLRRHPGLLRGLDATARPIERLIKTPVFGCRMCGQCTLHETGLTCPMGCPKTLRNGPCGGVRLDGRCEVVPSMTCIWVKAERRSRFLPWRGAFLRIQPALDWTQRGHSSWVNAALGRSHGANP
jgi:hypothetical protein